jgi:hypothetical protein
MVLFFCTQGWNNPGLEFANAFSVGHSAFLLNPGLEQPWAGICERLRRFGFGVRSSGIPGAPGVRRFGVSAFGVRGFSSKQTLAAIFTTQRELCLELSLPSKVSTEAENLLNFGYWTLFYAPVAVMSS